MGTRLLYLHEGAGADAVVEEWTGTPDPKDGSRHRLWLAQGGAVFGWVTCKTTSGQNNLAPTDQPIDAETGEVVPTPAAQIEYKVGSLMAVATPQPLVMRAGCKISTGRVGTMPPGTTVRLLETREHDGGLRARVERVAVEEDAVIVTADLNEFNYSVQRFASAAEYESARSSYCDEQRKLLEYVEDAITGSDLLIKEQVIYVNTGDSGAQNMRPEWKAVKEGSEVTDVLIKPSKRRAEGVHTAQPCLCIAGPGTGTTWMVRQIVHALATRLTDSDATGDGGVRLVPMIVFVQRVVRLLRETGNDPQKVVARRRMMLWYIENEFPGKAHKAYRDMLQQAWEMRALVILVDGVDEAANLRQHVEEFVHYELLPSGNRIMVTSRPEGITLPLYLTNFAIFSLRPLTESQQRRVAQSQMRGSAFYEHLMAFTSCRKKQDECWMEHFPSEHVRTKLEGLEFDKAEPPSGSTTPPSGATTPPSGAAEASAGPPAAAAVDASAAGAPSTEADGSGEQSIIDMLDHVVRTIAADAGMEADQVDEAISWLDESSGPLDKLVTELQVQAFARLEAYSEEQCLGIIERLMQGVNVSQEATGVATAAHLEMLHMHNRINNFDPTRTRDILCYMRLRYRGQSLTCEVQLVHSEIIRITEEGNAYTHIEYFRQQAIEQIPPSSLPNREQLYTLFENALKFADEAAGVPVLLSMFVLILVSGAEELSVLPTSRLELYQMATDSALRRRIKRTLPKVEETTAPAKETAVAPTKKKDKEAEGKEEAKKAEPKEAKDDKKKEKKDDKKSEKQGEKQNAVKKESKESKGLPQLNLAGAVAQKLEPLKGEENVTGTHTVAVRILDKVRVGDNLRDSIQRYVPEGNKLRPWVKAIVEAALEPATLQAQPVGLRMLRRIAIANQEAGRREFSSKDVALALGAHGDELILWLRLEQNAEHGVALIKQLEPQTDHLPAQYQFKHLSFQEGLFAEHLLHVVEDPTWLGWESDAVASAFLNNAYMNNTCRIAAGRLGTLLAKRRSTWSFTEHTLGIVGRRALWYLLEGNELLASLSLSGNEVGSSDTEGVVNLFKACYALKTLDLSNNHLDTLRKSQLSGVCRAVGNNASITELNLNGNRLGGDGCRAVCTALQSCVNLHFLGLSHNQPNREPALSDLVRMHPNLTSIEVVEGDSKHFDSRAKDNLGTAMIANDMGKLAFLQCDNFSVQPTTKALVWTSSVPADAVLLAGVLKTNTTLTSLGVAPGNKLSDSGRAAIGRALLQNKEGRVGFCDELGLKEGVKVTEIDLANSFHSVEAFLLLAGILRANRTLTSLTMTSLKTEHIEPLAEGLRSNSTLEILRLQSNVNTKGVQKTATVTLPIQLINGSLAQPIIDLSMAGVMTRVSCAVVGVLLAENKAVRTLKLSRTGLGSVVQAEGGHILFDPLSGGDSTLHMLDLSDMELGDNGGRKIFEALITGKCKRITSLVLSNNGLADETARVMHQLLQANDVCTLTSLDLSNNSINQQSLARAIKRNTTLKYLNIRGCGVSEEALRDIGDFLLEPECACRLSQIRCDSFEVEEGATVLDLTMVKLSSAAARLLWGVVKFNTTLETLILVGCGIDADGAVALEIALSKNESLLQCDLSSNKMASTSAGADALMRAAAANTKLTHITLDGPGSELSFKEMRTTHNLNLAHKRLRLISGTVVGAVAGMNRGLVELNLEGNELGPGGASAIMIGINQKPVLKVLSLSDCKLAGSGSWDLLTERSSRSRQNSARDGEEGENKEKDDKVARKKEEKEKKESKASKAAAAGKVADDDMNRPADKMESALDVKTRAQLAELMVSIGQISTLETLSLDNNKFSDAESKLLTPIGKLGSLRVLSLCNNRLTEVPASIGSLRSLTELLLRSNQLNELPNASIGLLGSLENLDLKGNSLTYLPDSIGQLRALKSLDLSENKLAEVPPSLGLLRDSLKLAVSRNPLQRPPLSVARQGIEAIRRYFNELKKSGSTTSRAARLVLLGAGLAGKTSLQRGLRHGAPRPSKLDERTIQLDIHTLPLGGGADQVVLSMWDLAGQPEYAAGLQPYIVPGSLYLLAVPAQIADDNNYVDVLGRWMDYLQAGAPEAVVQAVLTHCDELLPEGAKDKSVGVLEDACAGQVRWVKDNMRRHQAQLPQGSKKLLIQEQVPCVCAITGGDSSLAALRSRLETIVLAKPPLLPCIGMAIPRTWILAMSFLRALRDGRDPVLVATQSSQPEANTDKAVPYVSLADATQMWIDLIAPKLQLTADGTAVEDALQVLVNQGEFFASSGIIFLQPDYVTRLLKPLVDHRLGKTDDKPASGLGGVSILGYTIKDPVRAALLQEAVATFVKNGDLREELLPLMWEPVGLHEDDYGAVLLMLCASGVLFLAEHSSQGRKWVMPMRLKEEQPSDQLARWHRMRTQSGIEQLGISYPLGALAPPGISERLMSLLYGFGKYHAFWKGGALIETRIAGTLLLIELRKKDTGGEALFHELVLELRGPKTTRGDLFALLLVLRKRTEVLLSDFPGLVLEGKLLCPGCLWNPSHFNDPSRWSLEDVQSRALKCRKCEETVSLESVQMKQVAEPDRISLQLPKLETAGSTIERKYVGDLLRYGTPIEARQGLHKSLGVSIKKLQEIFSEGEDAILAEFSQNMSPDKDPLGWSDGDWLHYVLSQPAEEKALPTGFTAAKLDKGHKGMTLDDFVKHPNAVAADLDRATVLALRLYTTSAYKSINRPLREGRKHPYPALVAHMVDGITRLRAVAAKKEDQRPVEFFRGLKIDPSDEFFGRGCTDLSFMSTMRIEKKVAERLVSTEGANASVLIKMQLTPEQVGADISFLSCFPGEMEHLYGPGVYIEPKPERGGARMPGAVKTVEAQIHIKDHSLITKTTDDKEDGTTFVAPPPPAKGAKAKGEAKGEAKEEAKAPKEDKD